MATRIIQRKCRLCKDGIVDVVVTDQYDSGGNVIGVLEQRRKCRNGCVGNV
jgi:hypothetical protein